MSPGARWVRFNAVGCVGFVLQLSVLWILGQVTSLSPSMAVAAAVLITVTHNFLWHERVTWPNQPSAGRARRYLTFHLSTGVFSVVANVCITGAIARLTGMPLVPANAVAVGVASVAGFFVGDRLVFRRR